MSDGEFAGGDREEKVCVLSVNLHIVIVGGGGCEILEQVLFF